MGEFRFFIIISWSKIRTEKLNRMNFVHHEISFLKSCWSLRVILRESFYLDLFRFATLVALAKLVSLFMQQHCCTNWDSSVASATSVVNRNKSRSNDSWTIVRGDQQLSEKEISWWIKFILFYFPVNFLFHEIIMKNGNSPIYACTKFPPKLITADRLQTNSYTPVWKFEKWHSPIGNARTFWAEQPKESVSIWNSTCERDRKKIR